MNESVGKCGICLNPIHVGQTIVGLPIIRIVEEGKSVMAGTELIYHVRCFVEKISPQIKSKLEIVK